MKPEHKELFDKLTRLQKGVCLGVLSGKPYAQAYRDAGGIAKSDENANSIVSRMMSTDVNVRAFMDAVEEEAISSAVMTKQEALERLSLIASSTVKDIANWSEIDVVDAQGNASKQAVWNLKGSDEISDEAAAIISEISAGRDGFKFKTHSPLQAIKELSAMLGWNAPTKVAQTDSEGNDIEQSPREMAREILFALELLKREGSNGE